MQDSVTRDPEIARDVWHEEPWSFFQVPSAKLRDYVQRTYAEHPKATVSIIALIVLAVVVERPLYHHMIITARIYSAAVLMVLFMGYAGWRVFKDSSPRVKALGSVLGFILAIGALFGGKSAHEYVSQYVRYKTLEKSVVDLATRPLTDHERLLPLNGVHTAARERMNETESPTLPDLVRDGSTYVWTMAIEPGKIWGRIFHDVDELLVIPANEPSPDISRRSRTKVHFTVGEGLAFSRNLDTCVRRALAPWHLFSYEPGNVTRIKNDSGQWVHVVSWIKWSGWFFPWPEFGGVQVVEQGDTNIIGRNLWGCGSWISPEDIGKHKFLKGQNLVPYEATRFMAESLRFQAGFTGPMWFSRQGDLRIADMPEDVNQQPFTLFFRMPNGEAKLYQYFALEPRDKDKQGLSTSFYVPADGIGSKFAYRHFFRKEAPIGVTTVADQVRASRKNYDWSRNAPVEVRPYVHMIADAKGNLAPRFQWMVTVVTTKERKPGVPLEFTSGSDPEIALVDAYRARVVWVDSQHPDKWPEQLRASLGELWAAGTQ